MKSDLKKNLKQAVLKTAIDYCQVKKGRKLSKQEARWVTAQKLLELVKHN